MTDRDLTEESRQPPQIAGQGQARVARKSVMVTGTGQGMPNNQPVDASDQSPDRIQRQQQERRDANDEDEFQKSSYEKRKDARRQRLIVSGKASESRLKGDPPVVRDYFVYRMDKATTDDDMKDHLNDSGIDYISVTRISNSEATYCSYKVRVSLDQVHKIMNADIWPTGVRIRRFVVRRTNGDG